MVDDQRVGGYPTSQRSDVELRSWRIEALVRSGSGSGLHAQSRPTFLALWPSCSGSTRNLFFFTEGSSTGQVRFKSIAEKFLLYLILDENPFWEMVNW